VKTNTDLFSEHSFLEIDNVHVQNAFVLLDRLTLAGNHRYKSHFFTDSDHSIRTHNANHEIYWLLAENLWDIMGGYVAPAHHH
jgi:dipeptidyl aminopeptidase